MCCTQTIHHRFSNSIRFLNSVEDQTPTAWWLLAAMERCTNTSWRNNLPDLQWTWMTRRRRRWTQKTKRSTHHTRWRMKMDLRKVCPTRKMKHYWTSTQDQSYFLLSWPGTITDGKIFFLTIRSNYHDNNIYDQRYKICAGRKCLNLLSSSLSCPLWLWRQSEGSSGKWWDRVYRNRWSWSWDFSWESCCYHWQLLITAAPPLQCSTSTLVN